VNFKKFKPSKNAIIAFAIVFLATAWCWWATGVGLGLFLGAVLLAALYVPSLCIAGGPEHTWTILCALVLGICTGWAMAMPWADVTIFEFVRCCLVCGAFIWAMTGVGSLLQRATLPPHLAAALSSALALLWLTWPVWLSHALTQQIVNALVFVHPLLAINGVLLHLGTWDRAPIAYRQLTILNQDIPYHLPHSIFPAVAVHGVIGVLGIRWRRASPAFTAQ
jgi:hypothetical protein